MLNESRPRIGKVTMYTSLVFDDLTQEILGRGNHLRFKAYGNSMFPLVRNGDCLVVKPENAGGLKMGDIILYRYPCGTFKVHRLVKKTGQATLLTRGDNLCFFDQPVLHEYVLGKVTRIETQRRMLPLTGWSYRVFTSSTALLSRFIFRGQVRLMHAMGRLVWIMEGRRIN